MNYWACLIECGMRKNGETDADYVRRHNIVKRAKGRAADYPCEHCGGTALDWATIHGTDGLAVDDYMPLCRPCHRQYDPVGDRALGRPHTEESKRKIGQANLGHNVPQSTRDAVAASNQRRAGFRHTPEAKARMRAGALLREARKRGDANVVDVPR